MTKRQRCLDEVENRGGISLEEQQRKYERSFAPWPSPIQKKEEPDVVGEDTQFFFKTLTATSVHISSTRTLLELQKCLIIANANEFKLRDNPTSVEFEDILSDFQKWELRTEEHWIGDNETKDKMRAKLASVIKQARTKFRELSSK
ncbi:hypothetical protein KAT95_03640 [Candidatus Parcubacteria bacterium]|nr:hypothetical protein [Candidatus Parcubacteria bacterium]